MAYRYYIFCRSAEPVTRADLIAFLKDDVDFMDDHSPTFEPPAENAQGGGVLAVHYDDDGLITFKVRADQNAIGGSVDEVIDKFSLSGPLAERLLQTRTMVVIEPAVQVPDDVWGTLACVESFLTRERDGLIYNGKGLYDADRKTLAGEQMDAD
jgi:hypothetical protein